MKYLDEYRDPHLARALIHKIRQVSTHTVNLMEICGTHTVAIFRHGIRDVLPETVSLISGPGCPVCVTAAGEIDQAIKLAGTKDTIITTFGDLMRVPGSRSSLAMEKAHGADVRVVYSTFEALAAAREHPDRTVVFLGVGFETTAPTVAASIMAAKEQGLSNFCVFSAHKLLPPAMNAMLTQGEVKVNGFICPGHVTAIMGTSPYVNVARNFGTPCVVTGFEPLDILEGLWLLVRQLHSGEARVEIQYKRAVKPEGNPRALETMYTVFEPVDTTWRGMGVIPSSGLTIRPFFKDHDAAQRFDLSVPEAQDPPGCKCGEVIRGVNRPIDCALFRKSCTPASPVGPCMVSSEGTCSAYYKYLA